MIYNINPTEDIIMENEVLMEGRIFACETIVLRNRIIFAILLKDSDGEIHHLRIKGSIEEMTGNGQFADIGAAMINRVPIVLVDDGNHCCYFQAKDNPDQKIVFKTIYWGFN